MAEHRTRKDKENPHYNFLYSWTPSKPHVKGESNSTLLTPSPKLSAAKIADIQAKDEASVRIKKGIVRSLVTISFVLILEVVVYLAWKRFLS